MQFGMGMLRPGASRCGTIASEATEGTRRGDAKRSSGQRRTMLCTNIESKDETACGGARSDVLTSEDGGSTWPGSGLAPDALALLGVSMQRRPKRDSGTDGQWVYGGRCRQGNPPRTLQSAVVSVSVNGSGEATRSVRSGDLSPPTGAPLDDGVPMEGVTSGGLVPHRIYTECTWVMTASLR